MARYEVIARAKVDRRLPNSTYIDLAHPHRRPPRGLAHTIPRPGAHPPQRPAHVPQSPAHTPPSEA